jgi:hypothetical protein
MINNPKTKDKRFIMAIDYFIDYATEAWLKTCHHMHL